MILPPPRLVLASTSPRRRELLTQAGFRFEVVAPGVDGGVDEALLADEPALEYVERLARAKARAGLVEAQRRGLPAGRVLGADTTVCVDATILGKPGDRAEARHMLRTLSGRSHQVMTGICLTDGVRELAAVSVTRVRFRPLDDGEIEDYIDSGEPYDKAGGYGIQGRAARMVQNLEGSYSGVMGLPLFELDQLLRHFELAAGSRT